MTGFEPRTSVVGSNDCLTNWATTTAQPYPSINLSLILSLYVSIDRSMDQSIS